VLAARRSRAGLGLTPTDSLVERFGLFIIIVLGEVVLGVVAGLSVAERDAKTILTGMLALSMGFGFWWIYFDLVGRRLPRASRSALASWVMSHLPIALAITAAGAGMVSLIGHAHDPRTPAGASWLLAGAVATGLLALVLGHRARRRRPPAGAAHRHRGDTHQGRGRSVQDQPGPAVRRGTGPGRHLHG
jgi:low temperature requirement protein LtrA